MKNKKNIIFILFLLLLILASILGFSFYFQNRNKTIEIIQLSPQTHRQMMGYIIKTSNNKLIVIDGGTIYDKDNLLNIINDNGGKVDSWFLTHAHDDHCGAFVSIMNDSNIEIDNIYASLNDEEWYKKNEPSRANFSLELLNLLDNEKVKDKVISPNVNDSFRIDGLKIEILGIRNPEITENAGNEQSMVIKFSTPKTSFLILGDTGNKSSEKLLNTQKSKLKSDILQMSHHGQKGATKELYQEINPEICFWPTTDWLWNNDNGKGYNTGTWDTLKTREWMNELKVTKHYIAKDGDIRIEVK